MIHNNLSTLMGAKRISIAEVSRIAGVRYETVHKLYHDKNKGIEFATLDKLCWALECTPNDILMYIPDKAE